MQTVLSVNNLRKVYFGKRDVEAVKGITFNLHKGEILGLLGPNGSGKTTTIQMLLSVLSPTSGAISYFNKDLFHFRSEILQYVTFASTYTHLPSLLTVRECLEFYGRLYGLTKGESSMRFEPLLERFGISANIGQRVSNLSAGQLTRLMLVKAFFVKPKIVLLDEPTASLDPDIANDICLFLCEAKEKDSISILFTSHRMDEVMRICDRVLFLKEGKIVADDAPEKLAKRASMSRISFQVVDGFENAHALLDSMGLVREMDRNLIAFEIDEEAIPSLLRALTLSSVKFQRIKIEEPSLDSLFVSLK